MQEAQVWEINPKFEINPINFFDTITKMKLDDIEKRLGRLEKKGDQESFFSKRNENRILFDAENFLDPKRKEPVSEGNILEGKKMIERVFEILEDWEESGDLQLQIQYATIIIAKIDKIRKLEFVKENDTIKKICVLLRNVIRLNTVDDLLTEGQMNALKKGFALIVKDSIEKEDLFTLNRRLGKEKLMTMPTWG